MVSRSRSPHGRKPYLGFSQPHVPAKDDVVAAQALREAYEVPKQSFFRVAAILRFRRRDGSEGTIEAVNAEPHDANIRGAICAERAALCKFQREESENAEINRVVCVTDSLCPIFPGPMCREFLISVCPPETEVVIAGSKDPFNFAVKVLRDLLPLPSVYARKDVKGMQKLAESLESIVTPPADNRLVAPYGAALEKARKQKAQQRVFPIVFAAAVQFSDGRIHCVAELKAMEYGGTVDAVSLLMPELMKVKEDKSPGPVAIVQVDQYGVAHAPFASARTLMVEHGFRHVLFAAHNASGEWEAPIEAYASLPSAFVGWEGGVDV